MELQNYKGPRATQAEIAARIRYFLQVWDEDYLCGCNLTNTPTCLVVA